MNEAADPGEVLTAEPRVVLLWFKVVSFVMVSSLVHEVCAVVTHICLHYTKLGNRCFEATFSARTFFQQPAQAVWWCSTRFFLQDLGYWGINLVIAA